MMRYIDQLGDIWYDRADRAETLLQFSRAIDGNDKIIPDLKVRILEQVNLIYTQGQQDAEEKDLARTMLNDFLSKSPNKNEIFGDGTPENRGLLGQIIENPEYYEQNKKLVERIYNEYVKFDTTLSEDAKAIIREKLLFLAGTPPVTKTTDGEAGKDPIETDEPGIFSKIQEKLGNMTSILLWIGIAMIGLLGIAFAWKKIMASRQMGETLPGEESINNTLRTPDPAGDPT